MAHIVVIDDQPQLLELLRDVLIFETPHRVVSRSHATVAELIRLRPDLLIVDNLLTDRSRGVELLSQVRESQKLVAVPAILLTADSGAKRELRSTAHRLNARLLVKPFTLDVFLSLVDELLEQPMQVRQADARPQPAARRELREGLAGEAAS